jgi:alcohol dehydrogenase class IV
VKPRARTWIESLCADLEIPPLSQYGVTADDVPVILAEAQKASSTKGNPIALQDGELAGVLRQAM